MSKVSFYHGVFSIAQILKVQRLSFDSSERGSDVCVTMSLMLEKVGKGISSVTL